MRAAARAARIPGTIWTADGRELNGAPTRTFLGSGDWYVHNRLAGDSGDGSLGDLVPSAVTVQNVSGANVLRIRGDDVGAGNSPRGRRYTCGELQLSTMTFTGGTFEARIWFGSANGCRGAFWVLGQNCQQTLKFTEDNSANCNWPNPGSREMDLAEIIAGDSAHVNSQIHTNVSNTQNLYNPGVDVSLAWHTYKSVWTPGVSLVSYFDGSHIGTDIAVSDVPNEAMFVVLSYFLGPQGVAVGATLPVDMLIDYVSVS